MSEFFVMVSTSRPQPRQSRSSGLNYLHAQVSTTRTHLTAESLINMVITRGAKRNAPKEDDEQPRVFSGVKATLTRRKYSAEGYHRLFGAVNVMAGPNITVGYRLKSSDNRLGDYCLGREPKGFNFDIFRLGIEKSVEAKLEGTFFGKREILLAFGAGTDEAVGTGLGDRTCRQTVRDAGICGTGTDYTQVLDAQQETEYEFLLLIQAARLLSIPNDVWKQIPKLVFWFGAAFREGKLVDMPEGFRAYWHHHTTPPCNFAGLPPVLVMVNLVARAYIGVSREDNLQHAVEHLEPGVVSKLFSQMSKSPNPTHFSTGYS